MYSNVVVVILLIQLVEGHVTFEKRLRTLNYTLHHQMLAMEKIARLKAVMFILGVLIHDYIKIDYTVF